MTDFKRLGYSIALLFCYACLFIQIYIWNTKFFFKEVASITLRNAHKKNKKAKSECSFTLLYFKLSLGFGLDHEFGLGLTLGLDQGLELGLGLK